MGTENKSLANVPLKVGPNGIQIETFEGLMRFANVLSASGMVPKELQGNPAACIIALELGLELGMAPMAAVQNIAVINGRPAVWGDAALATIQTHPEFLDIDEEIEGEGDLMVAVCRAYKKSRGMDRPVERRYSVEDAKRAGLWGKSGPWSQHPKRMLQMRARSFAIRDAFPGALKGMILAEEARDIKDVTDSVVVEPVAELVPTATESKADAFLRAKRAMDTATQPTEPPCEGVGDEIAPEPWVDTPSPEDDAPTDALEPDPEDNPPAPDDNEDQRYQARMAEWREAVLYEFERLDMDNKARAATMRRAGMASMDVRKATMAQLQGMVEELRAK